MDATEKSFDLVQGVTQLLITLSTALIAFGVTFAKELGGFRLDAAWDRATWSAALVFMMISVASGIWTLLGLTTVLSPRSPASGYVPSIREPKVKVPFAIQIVAFALSAIAMALFGIAQVFWQAPPVVPAAG